MPVPVPYRYVQSLHAWPWIEAVAKGVPLVLHRIASQVNKVINSMFLGCVVGGQSVRPICSLMGNMSTRMNARTCNGSPPIWPLANADLRGRMIRGSSWLALTRWINHSAPAHSIGIRQCNGSNSRGTNNVIDRGTEEQKPMMAKNRHGRRSRSNVIIMIILISAIAVYLVIQRQTDQQQQPLGLLWAGWALWWSVGGTHRLAS